jgi:plastocyanin
MDNEACIAGTDCVSGVCAMNVCQAPTCMDMVQNGNETDVDCGGADCGPCALGENCGGASDCAGGICTANVCSQINGCDLTNATDVTGVAAATVASVGLTYNPKCLLVSVGTILTVNSNFASHPFVGGEYVNGMKVQAMSGPFVPITNMGLTKDFTMSSAGIFPYYCDFHAGSGMTGVVFVVP